MSKIRLSDVPGTPLPSPKKAQGGQRFLQMPHGKATDAMAQMNSRDAQINHITESATIISNDVKLTIQKFKELGGTLNINTHKLLSVGIAEFTTQNHIGSTTQSPNLTVSIPFKEYAIRCGCDLVERETSTPEEAEAEKKRIMNLEKDFKKKVKKDLDMIRATELEWTEKIKGKSEDFMKVSIIGSRGIKGGYIHMVFDPVMASYLCRLPMTQYPVALLSLDARNSNSYSMGLKMSEYFNMDANQNTGRADRISVLSLLACTGIPTIEEIRSKRQGWERLIKEPFEKALDNLYKCGFLEDWQYTKAKAVPLTDEEAAAITDYETFSKLYIQFSVKDSPDQTPRLEAKREKAAEEKKKQASKRKPRKKKGEYPA